MRLPHMMSALILTLIPVASITHAESLAHQLIKCDSSVFEELLQREDIFTTASREDLRQTLNTWATSTTSPRVSLRVPFKHPIKDDSLTFTALTFHTGEAFNINDQFYYWGLETDGTVDEAVHAMADIPWKQDAPFYMYNPQIKRIHDTEWRPNTAAIGGVAPARNTVEKVALLEPSLINPRVANLDCSIQGSAIQQERAPIFTVHH